MWVPSGRRFLPLHSQQITSFTLALNYAYDGLQIEGFHHFNLAVHLLCGLGSYGVMERAVGRYGRVRGPALVCALLWFLHPLNSVSVEYVSQRSGLLRGLFYFLSFDCVQRGMAQGKRWYAACAVRCAKRWP